MTRPRRTKFDPAIERVSLDKVTIIEITEAELDALERGSPESLFLNLAIAALSVASSFLIALLTTKIENIKAFCIFVIISALGFISGATFALL